MPRHPSHLLKLAALGAEARLQDLMHEARLLFRLFPHLRDAFDRDELPVAFLVAAGSGRLTKTPATGRRKMSVAGRKAVSQRMQRYWAARRTAKA